MYKKDITGKMNKNLPRPISKLLKQIGGLAHRDGCPAYAVGGFVRDLILGKTNLDLDIAIEGDGIEFARKLSGLLKGTMVEHKRFGTASVFLSSRAKASVLSKKKNFRIDIATARKESYRHPGALPEVEASYIKYDLYRRDFTINAMAVSLNKKTYGILIDYFGGMEDLKAGMIRAIHEKSFADDPTRIFRAVRFEQRYGFKIESDTKRFIKNAISAKMFERISRERLRQEIVAILKEKKPLKAIERMNTLDELQFIHPRIKLDSRIKKLIISIDVIMNRPGRFTAMRPHDIWLIYFMALLDKLNYNDTKLVCHKFAFSRSETKRILEFKRFSVRIGKALNKKERAKPSSVYKALNLLSSETIIFVMAKFDIKIAAGRISDFMTDYRDIKIGISGEDLKNMGHISGPLFKDILNRVLYAKIDGVVSGKEEELELADKLLLKALSEKKCASERESILTCL